MPARSRILLSLLLTVILSARGWGAGYEEDPQVVEKAEEDLMEALRSEISLIIGQFVDDSDVSYERIGSQWKVWLSPATQIKLQILQSDIEQEADAASGRPRTDFGRDVMHISINDVRVLPYLTASGGFSFEEFDEGDIAGGHVSAALLRESGSLYGIGARRESLWTRHDERDPRGYSRIKDLSLLNQDFEIDTIEAFADILPRLEHELLLSGGISEYDDDNERLHLYGHYHFPVLDNTPQKWTVLRPNVYYESYDEERAAYFSPDFNVTIGLAGHTVRKSDRRTRFEAEVNPLLIFRDEGISKDSEAMFGFHVVLDLTIMIQRVSLGVGGFYYWEEEGYDLLRGVGKVSIEI